MAFRFTRWFRRPAVLVVCSGNTCRSPLGEYLIRDMFQTARVWSRGTAVWGPAPMATNSRIVIEDLTGNEGAGADHVARALMVEDIWRADLVVCMTKSHADTVTRLAAGIPWYTRPRVVTLNVPDPFGGPLHQYRVTGREILAQVARIGLRARAKGKR